MKILPLLETRFALLPVPRGPPVPCHPLTARAFFVKNLLSPQPPPSDGYAGNSSSHAEAGCLPVTDPRPSNGRPASSWADRPGFQKIVPQVKVSRYDTMTCNNFVQTRKQSTDASTRRCLAPLQAPHARKNLKGRNVGVAQASWRPYPGPARTVALWEKVAAPAARSGPVAGTGVAAAQE